MCIYNICIYIIHIYIYMYLYVYVHIYAYVYYLSLIYLDLELTYENGEYLANNMIAFLWKRTFWQRIGGQSNLFLLNTQTISFSTDTNFHQIERFSMSGYCTWQQRIYAWKVSILLLKSMGKLELVKNSLYCCFSVPQKGKTTNLQIKNSHKNTLLDVTYFLFNSCPWQHNINVSCFFKK